MPGEFIELTTPRDVEPDGTWALKPRYDILSSIHMQSEELWLTPQDIQSVNHTNKPYRRSNVTEVE